MGTADATALRAALRRWASGVGAEAGPETVRLARQDPRTPDGPPRTTPGPKLKDSIGVVGVRDTGSGITVQVEAKGWGAVTTDRGSRPHVILPRNAKVLRFETGGQVVFSRRVNHPGTAAQDWWEPVLNDAWGQALQTAAQRVRF